ncbi:tRNA-intron lyase [Candidatus Bathyarchaeota archaeon]|nr:tRNA-intron lyase [Candidatus Bathyarchaeota archaeon]
MEGPPVEVEALRDSRLIVWSVEEGQRLYGSGFYGKPLGNPRPKEDFEEPLILDPVEGVYLLERGLITVYSGAKRRQVSPEELLETSRRTLERFDDKYTVYRDLRGKGFIVAPGIKYGCDFAVYEHGPGVDHAPYILQVRRRGDELSAAEIVKAGRLASTVRKTFIVAVVEGDEIEYLEFKWWKA